MSKTKPRNSMERHFCQYLSEGCSRPFYKYEEATYLFFYPSDPPLIASVIESAATTLSNKYTSKKYVTWKELKTEGQIIFCEICKAVEASNALVCDITNLNFNVLFEIGYIVGRNKPFLPIFDTSFSEPENQLKKIGLLDTTGYKPFTNSQDIISLVEAGIPSPTIAQNNMKIDFIRPLYYVKSPLATDESIKLTSILKKSWFNCRIFDPTEGIRLALNIAIKQVTASRAVILHLLSPERKEALTHNARCAFVAGLALASQKHTLLLQERTSASPITHPIDYRDIIKEYTHPNQIPMIMDDFFKELVQTVQPTIEGIASAKRSILEDLDLGDTEAESEIDNLRHYYLRTGEFTSARKGHAQLITGRKGSGKTALFYALRHYIGPEKRDVLILDLKPEGYQFAKLYDTILQKITPAIQEHTLTALWDYVLLLELAHKVLNDKKEKNIAYADTKKLKEWESLAKEYECHRPLEQGDFSERLNALIESIMSKKPKVDLSSGSPEITQLVFNHDIKNLRTLLVDYLSDKEQVWVLFDNLDKNWKLNKKSDYEVIVLRSLLTANRKLRRMIKKEEINFNSIIFLRNDIYSFFLHKTSDRGKDQVISLDWNDPQIFKEIFRLRADNGNEFTGTANDIWTKVFDLHVAGQSSFNYIIERTLMRPRDFLIFMNYALHTAINRGKDRITDEDIRQAEKSYSMELFQGLSYELYDINPKLENILYCFLECKKKLTETELKSLLCEGKILPNKCDEVVETLLWFSFLGIYTSDMSERYSYSVGYDIKKLLRLSDWTKKQGGERIFCVHPGFEKVLESK
jgi:hypothetical protein